MVVNTVQDTIYILRTKLNALSDDSSLSNRLLYRCLKSARSLLMKRALDQKKLYKSMEFQPLNCYEFELVDLSTCCEVKTGYKVLKSKDRIPDLIDTTLSLAVRGIYSIELGTRFDLTTLNNLQAQLSGRFTVVKPQAFIFGNYLYVYGITNIPETAFTIDGLWENPEIVWEINQCKGKRCNCDDQTINCISYLDAEFPYPHYMEDAIIEESIKGLETYFKIPKDKQNDGRASI